MPWRALAESLPIFLLGLYLPTLPEHTEERHVGSPKPLLRLLQPSTLLMQRRGFLSKTTASLTNLTLSPNSPRREGLAHLPCNLTCMPSPKTPHNRMGNTLLPSSSRENVPGFGRLCRLRRRSFSSRGSGSHSPTTCGTVPATVPLGYSGGNVAFFQFSRPFRIQSPQPTCLPSSPKAGELGPALWNLLMGDRGRGHLVSSLQDTHIHTHTNYYLWWCSSVIPVLGRLRRRIPSLRPGWATEWSPASETMKQKKAPSAV